MTGNPQSRVATIVAAVAQVFGVSPKELLGPRRARYVSHPRQVAMVLARDLCPDKSLPMLGREFDRDHTTIIHAIEAVAKRRKNDAELDLIIKDLEAKLSEELSDTVSDRMVEMAADRIASVVAQRVRERIIGGASDDPQGFVYELLKPAPDRMHENDVRLPAAARQAPQSSATPINRASGAVRRTAPPAPPPQPPRMPRFIPTDAKTLGLIRRDFEKTRLLFVRAREARTGAK